MSKNTNQDSLPVKASPRSLAFPQKMSDSALVEMFPALQDVQGVAEALVENFPDGITTNDLIRTKWPSGTSKAFALVDQSGEIVEDEIKEVRGILIHASPTRVYYARSFDESGGKDAPACVSSDGKIGEGDPGGPCVSCALSKFHEDKAPPCAIGYRLFLLRPEDFLPVLVRIPTGSVKSVRSYMTALTRVTMPFWKILTKLSLTTDKSRDGIAYPKASFAYEPIELDAAAIALVRTYRQATVGALSRVQEVAPADQVVDVEFDYGHGSVDVDIE